MIPISKYLSTPPPISIFPQQRIDIPRHRDLKPLHSPGKCLAVLRLGEHMNVRPLDAQMHDPEPLAHRGHDRRRSHPLVHRPPTKTPDGVDHPHHHMQRVIRLDHRPSVMPFSSSLRLRLPPCPLALPAVPEQLLLHVSLARPLRPRRLHLLCITPASSHVN